MVHVRPINVDPTSFISCTHKAKILNICLMDAQTRLEILNEVIPLAVSFQFCARRRILTGQDVAMALEILGYSQVSLLSPLWPDVCFEGLEEDLESKSMEGRSPGGSMNDSGELTDEDEYLKRVSRRDRKLEKYLFENNPTGNKAHRAVHLDKVNSTIRARLVPDPALVCRLSSSDDWRADRAGEGNYKVGGIGEMDGMPKAMPVMSGTEEAFANATSELIQNIPSGGMATVYQLLDFVANERYGKIAVFLIARCVQSTVGRFVNIGGIGAIPLRYMRLLALLARGTVQISAGGRGERGDEASKELEVSLCSLVGSLARLALDTSLPQSMAQNAQGGGYPMSPILPPKGAQTPRLAGRAARQSGVAAAVCDSLQLVSFRDMCSKCFMECSRLVDAPKLVEHVRLCVRDRWRNVAEKEAITRADVMALSSVIGVVKSKRSKEFEFDEGNVCSKWLLTDLEGDNNSAGSQLLPEIEEFERELSLVYLEEKAKLADYFLATSLLCDRTGIGDDYDSCLL